MSPHSMRSRASSESDSTMTPFQLRSLASFRPLRISKSSALCGRVYPILPQKPSIHFPFSSQAKPPKLAQPWSTELPSVLILMGPRWGGGPFNKSIVSNPQIAQGVAFKSIERFNGKFNAFKSHLVSIKSYVLKLEAISSFLNLPSSWCKYSLPRDTIWVGWPLIFQVHFEPRIKRSTTCMPRNSFPQNWSSLWKYD